MKVFSDIETADEAKSDGVTAVFFLGFSFRIFILNARPHELNISESPLTLVIFIREASMSCKDLCFHPGSGRFI